MSENKLFQETLFSFLGEEKAEEIQKKVKKEKEKKEAKKTQTGTKSNDVTELDLTAETIIRYQGEEISITEFFTVEELDKGLIRKEDGKEKATKITTEDVRSRLFDEWPELTKEFGVILFSKEQNMIVPTVSGKKRGMILGKNEGVYLSVEEAVENKKRNMYLPSRDGKVYHLRETDILAISKPASWVNLLPNLTEGVTFKLPKIPMDKLMKFVHYARLYAYTYITEIYAEFFWNQEKGIYELYIPKQVVTKDRVIPSFDARYEQLCLHCTRVMTIHSHHYYDAKPSRIDDENERETILHCIVGRVNNLFPSISVRTFFDGRYMQVEPSQVFEMPDWTKEVAELSQVSFGKEEGDGEGDE